MGTSMGSQRVWPTSLSRSRVNLSILHLHVVPQLPHLGARHGLVCVGVSLSIWNRCEIRRAAWETARPRCAAPRLRRDLIALSWQLKLGPWARDRSGLGSLNRVWQIPSVPASPRKVTSSNPSTNAYVVHSHLPSNPTVPVRCAADGGEGRGAGWEGRRRARWEQDVGDRGRGP
jgi:hypothetical protein